jgi:hypothetical protein
MGDAFPGDILYRVSFAPRFEVQSSFDAPAVDVIGVEIMKQWPAQAALATEKGEKPVRQIGLPTAVVEEAHGHHPTISLHRLCQLFDVLWPEAPQICIQEKEYVMLCSARACEHGPGFALIVGQVNN